MTTQGNEGVRRDALIDPDITDAMVAAQVERSRWFWILLLKDGPLDDLPEREAAAVQAAHLRHLLTLQRRGQLTLFGPVREAGPLRGIGVVTVETREEAEALFAKDPWVAAGGLVAEIRPFFTMPGVCLPG
jgi:uncharacterized protein